MPQLEGFVNTQVSHHYFVHEGLSSTGDHYDEAIECLKARYNRPRLIHQAHV